MRTVIMTVICIWLLSVQAAACDVCGCGASGNFLGILPQYQKHFIGLSYQYQSFSSIHPEVEGSTSSQESSDHFQSLTAWGRFYPFKRLQVFVFVPYHYNYVQEAGQTTVMDGLGDISISANYMLLNTADSTHYKLKHTLLIGGGIKTPTGKNNFTNNEGIILSNMQPGTGSWDFMLNMNYTLRYRSIGLSTEASYQIPTVNQRDYLYGNKLNAGMLAFSWQQINQLSLLPQAGVRMQYSAQDLSSYEYNISNPYSGGTQWYATAGMGCYYKAFAVTGLYSLPFAGNYADGLVTAHNRFELQLQYLF